MKKCMTIFLVVFLLLSCAVPAFAAEVSDKAEIDVNAKAEYTVQGEYPANIENGGGTVETDDGTTVTVENAPTGAVRLMVVPIPTSETVAWDWIKGCFADKATPIHTFDIYFADESGNRINADGATVTIDCPHCTAKPMVCSLTTNGEVKELSNNARFVSVTFTTDGSHYYVMTEKLPEPSKDNKVEIKDNPDGNVEVSDKTPNTGDTVTVKPKPDEGKVVDKITVTDKDGNKIEVKDNGDGSYSFEQPDGDVTIDVTYKDKTTHTPQTGDNSHLWLWITLGIVVTATAVFVFLFVWKKRKQSNANENM